MSRVTEVAVCDATTVQQRFADDPKKKPFLSFFSLFLLFVLSVLYSTPVVSLTATVDSLFGFF